MIQLSSHIRKARKQHTCDYCGLPIAKGEKYHSSTHVYDNMIYSWKSHFHCETIASKLNMFDWCDEGVTGEDFQEFIKDEYCNIMSDKYPDTYEAVGFIIPSFEDRLKFVLKEHGIL